MNIRPSAAIRQNYNEIADLCRKSMAPVYLTKNGEGDLVVMDIDSFTRRGKKPELRENLLALLIFLLQTTDDWMRQDVPFSRKHSNDSADIGHSFLHPWH